MKPIRILPALFLLIAGTVAAQESTEYSRTSGGEIEALTKPATKKLSASLGATLGSRRGYEASFGGTIVEDRLWFFASTQQQQYSSTTPQMAQPVDVDATFGKAIAQIGDRQNVMASFATGSQSSPMMPGGTIPSSFLNLRYTGTISSNMHFSASFLSQRQ